MSHHLFLTGLIIPIWLLLGLMIAGTFYPEYNHLHQAMSELGAIGAPTHRLSPLINNYPLGILFILFGLTVINYFKISKLAITSGMLLILHGLASIGAGYFSCDLYCLPETPSLNQQLHNFSGLIMFLSLSIANALWIFLNKKTFNSQKFLVFSIICLIISVGSALLLPIAIEQNAFFGLYQRINYGAGVIWIAGLSIMGFVYLRKNI